MGSRHCLGSRWYVRCDCMQQARIRIAAAVVAALSGIGVVRASILFFISLFTFDDPASTHSTVAYVKFLSLVSIPSFLALSCFLAINCLIRPKARLLIISIIVMVLSAILFNIVFDPLRLRHYPPAQECNNSAFTDASGRHVVRHSPLPGPQRMICHDLRLNSEP